LHEKVGLHLIACLYRNHLCLSGLCDTEIIRGCIFAADQFPNPFGLVSDESTAFK
jgi:hypothetical protein